MQAVFLWNSLERDAFAVADLADAEINAVRLSQSSCYARQAHELQPWLQHLLQCYAPPALGYVNALCMP